MNTRKTSKLLAASLLLCLAGQSYAQTLFLTGRNTTVRTSTDGGATWSTFATVTGGALRGLEVGNVGGSNYVFVNDFNGPNTAVPLLAFNSTGTQVASTTYNRVGSFNQQPLNFFGGYVYASTGGTPQNISTSFNGSAFGTSVDSQVGNFQGDNITFSTVGANSYMYTLGAASTSFRRNTVLGTGLVGVSANTVTTSGTTGNFTDIAFTPAGRLMVISSGGIYLSASGSQESNSIALSSAFAFTATENAATGDMGANARDFSLIGNTLFAVTDTRVFRYTLNDATGSLIFDSAFVHGFNSNGVQIAGFSPIPEPASFAALAGLGALGLVGLRRRRRA